MSKQKTKRVRLQIRFNWKITLCVLFVFTVLVQLGFWQLRRAEQKRQAQSTFDARRLARPVAIESLNLEAQKTLEQTRIIVKGHYDNSKTILVSNQIFQGQPGYEVITAFAIDSSEQVVLVSRGWLAADYSSRQIPSIVGVNGNQELIGTIHLPAGKSFFLPEKIDNTPSWPLRIHHFEFKSISQLFDRPLLPFLIRLDQNSPGVFKRHWRVPHLQTTNSISYAIQWFAMALMLVVIVIIKSTNILELMRSQKTIE